MFFKPIPFVANYLFGAQNETLLRSILDDTDLKFTKWALIVLCYWNNKESFKDVLKINGDKDKLLPPRGNTKMIIIKKGEHFMIVDRANEVSCIINTYI